MMPGGTAAGALQRVNRVVEPCGFQLNGAGLGGGVVDQGLIVVATLPRATAQQRISKGLSINKGGVAGHIAPLPLTGRGFSAPAPTPTGWHGSARRRRAPYRVLFSGLAFALVSGAEKAQPLRWAFSWVLVSIAPPFQLFAFTFNAFFQQVLGHISRPLTHAAERH